MSGLFLFSHLKSLFENKGPPNLLLERGARNAEKKEQGRGRCRGRRRWGGCEDGWNNYCSGGNYFCWFDDQGFVFRVPVIYILTMMNWKISTMVHIRIEVSFVYSSFGFRFQDGVVEDEMMKDMKSLKALRCVMASS